MANPLSELFGKIAKSIRGGLGDTGKLKPAVFPDKIDEIVKSISEEADEIDFYLDEINGEVVGEQLFYITFMNGTELIQVPVYEGYDCADPIETDLIETPTKESTKYIAYTFVGWSLTEGGEVDESALAAVDGNRTVYAVYSEAYIYVAQGSWVNPDYGDGSYYMNWKLNPDYELTVEGEFGSIFYPNYTPYQSGGTVPPWWGYQSEIASVILKCSGIGAGWFYNCTKLGNVTLDDRCSIIGLYAFSGCTALTSISLPPAMRTIANHAFDSAALTNITIPEKTKYIYEYAFKDTALESVIFERTDGWYYGSMSYPATNGGTLVSEEQAKDPTFAVPIFVGVNRNDWENSNAT